MARPRQPDGVGAALTKFAISVPTDEGEEIRFILLRSGLQWKLSGVEMPVTK
jgi:hypothetical protein